MSGVKPLIEVTEDVTKVYCMTLHKREMLHILSYYFGYEIPEGAEMIIHVPSGGDWSNMDLSLEENPIRITWRIKEVKTNEKDADSQGSPR